MCASAGFFEGHDRRQDCQHLILFIRTLFILYQNRRLFSNKREWADSPSTSVSKSFMGKYNYVENSSQGMVDQNQHT